MQQIGTIGVDAGLCWVGDPCYVLGDDASSRVTDWMEFCGKLDHNKTHNEPLGSGTGLAISTGYGDGEYPVFIETNGEGRVSAIRIEFMEDEDSEDQCPDSECETCGITLDYGLDECSDCEEEREAGANSTITNFLKENDNA